MRRLILSLALTLIAASVQAFEIEELVQFPADGARVELRVISTADTDLFAPFIASFQAQNPGVSILYHVASSAELMIALADENAPFDLAISSAMDLQIRLANDGLSRRHQSDRTQTLPSWARWHDQVFAFTLEPATIVLSRAAFDGLTLPRSRQELIEVMRDNPDRFTDRIGTYDVRESGLGYLFATQDGRASETFWRLAEVMGGLGTRLYCCSGAMIEDAASGELAVAYNVLGSYAQARTDLHDAIHIIAPEDFTTVMMRTILIPNTTTFPDEAGLFVDHLIDVAWLGSDSRFAFPGITPDDLSGNATLRPIQLGPGLLVYLDRLKRRQFLTEWEAALIQPE